jgi:hypothetical protein
VLHCLIACTRQHAASSSSRYLYLGHKYISISQVLITGSLCQKQYFHQIELSAVPCHMVNGYISPVCFNRYSEIYGFS